MIKAIIVDDEPAVAVIIRYFVSNNNLPVEIVGEARNGNTAIELIERFDPGLIFCDIQMPGMNGFELMKACPNRNYVIITAYESFQYAQQALRLGAKDILLKPIEFEPLNNSISRALGWRFTQNQLTNDIIEYIQTHYNQKIEVNELAQMYYTAPSHIARTFKKHTGRSVIEYLHQVRVAKAVDLIRGTNLEIKEISEQCGYESLNNFYKYFKLNTGTTPANYRANGAVEANR